MIISYIVSHMHRAVLPRGDFNFIGQINRFFYNLTGNILSVGDFIGAEADDHS